MDQRALIITAVKTKLLTDSTGATSLKALTGHSDSNDVIGRQWREGLVHTKYLAIHILSMRQACDAPSTIRVMFDLICAGADEIDALKISDRVQYLIQQPEASTVRSYWDFSVPGTICVKSCQWRNTGMSRYLSESKRYTVAVTVSAVVTTVTNC